MAIEPVTNTLPLTSSVALGVDLFIPTSEPLLYIDPVVSTVAPSNIAA
jgi:hypothetical protein